MSSKAVLLLNLGSPDSTKVADVRRYLHEFLSDERVLDMASWKRSLLLNLFILPRRSKESAQAYKTVWLPEGSPLVVTSQRQQQLVQEQVDIPVALAMRYGNPSTASTIHKLAQQGIDDLYVMPLYPHYAMSSYETVEALVREEVARQKPKMRLSFLPPFYQEEGYINALVSNSQPYLDDGYDLLLFSFHGLPERHLRLSDPSHAHCLSSPDCCNNPHACHATCYRHQCFKTVEKFVAAAGIPSDKYAVSFQSRLLKDPWLKPYTDHELERFAKQGVKNIKVMCPAFVTDCLETLEEIAIRGKESFVEAGGESLSLIPCLNEHPEWITFLLDKIRAFAQTDNA